MNSYYLMYAYMQLLVTLGYCRWCWYTKVTHARSTASGLPCLVAKALNLETGPTVLAFVCIGPAGVQAQPLPWCVDLS
jgi:hypothetical protein